MTEPKLDKAVRGLADEVLAERLSVLSARGLRVKMEVKQWSMEDRENSEIRISFWRQNSFVDFFEGFIVRDGKALASLGEFKEWLEREVDTILEQNPEGSATA